MCRDRISEILYSKILSTICSNSFVKARHTHIVSIYFSIVNSVFRPYETPNTWIEYLMSILETFHLINNLRKATCNYVVNLCWLGTVHSMSSFLLAQNCYVCMGCYNILHITYTQFSFALICVSSNSNEAILKYMIHSADSMFVPNQWETLLQSNTVSNWLGANIKSALYGYHQVLPNHNKTQQYGNNVGDCEIYSASMSAVISKFNL